MLRTVAVAALFAFARSRAAERLRVTRARRASIAGHHAVDLDGLAVAVGSAAESHGARAAPAGDKLTAQLKTADGTTVATAEFEFSGGYATVTVEDHRHRSADAGLPRPAHPLGRQVRSRTRSPRPAARRATSIPRAGISRRPATAAHPASGDLTSLQVREDGTAELVTTTDAFTAEDLLAGQKTSIIIHEKADNFANIPPERYQQTNGTPPPDQTTMATGDAGKRVACGVIGTG